MKLPNNSPIRHAWACEKGKLGELKQKLMEVMDIKSEVQFYDFVNGHRKTITEDQKEKVAALFGKPVKTLFPPEPVFE